MRESNESIPSLVALFLIHPFHRRRKQIKLIEDVGEGLHPIFLRILSTPKAGFLLILKDTEFDFLSQLFALGTDITDFTHLLPFRGFVAVTSEACGHCPAHYPTPQPSKGL